MSALYSASDCIRGMYDTLGGTINSNIDCIGILKPSTLKEEYRDGDYQLFHIRDGFGAYPDKMGNAVFGEFCVDGEHCRMEKPSFVGIADEEATKYALELERRWNNG